MEFHPGYRAPGLLLDASRVRPWVVAALGLQLTRVPRPELVLPSAAGGPDEIRVSEGVAAGLAGAVSAADREGYAGLVAFVQKVRPVVVRIMDRAPLSVRDSLWSLLKTGWAVRRLGGEAMTELMRVAPMAIADWMRDRLETERLRAGLAVGALEGAYTGPWSAHTALQWLVREALAGDDVVGGPAALATALEAAARATGVEIRTGTQATRILCGGAEADGGVTGVALMDGEVIATRAVLSTLDPKATFGRLVGPPAVPLALADAARAYRMRGATGVVWMALSGPLETRAGTIVAALRTGESLDQVERAWDAAKYRAMAERPILDLRVPSVADPSLAPAGGAVVQVHAHAAAFDLAGGWSDDARALFGARVVDALGLVCPSAPSRILGMRVWSPADIAAEFGVSHGHLWHGEHAPDQLVSFRPAIAAGRYATSIPGLYLGGGATHPGGGAHLGNGALAALAMRSGPRRIVTRPIGRLSEEPMK
jgi:phytoene dehydrogenase-like protein